MHYYRRQKLWATLLVAGSLTAFSSQAIASAFMLHEASASLLGEFYAGNAAIAEDASTNYFNSAGLTRLSNMGISASGVNVSTFGEFKGYTNYTTGLYPEVGEASNGAARLIPAVHLSKKLGDKWAVGFSATAPWGLATEYEDTSLVRYQATYSDFKTINLSPSIAFQAVDWLSFGAGFDAQYARAELDAVIGLGIAPFPPFIPDLDSQSINKGDSWGYGWHAGALAAFKTGTQLGVNFRSEVEQNLKGHSKLMGPLNPNGFESRDLKATVTMPWFIDASITQTFAEKFTAMATVEYINWSTIDQLKMENVQAPSLAGTSIVATTVDPLEYKNSWTFLTAMRYAFNDSVMVKAGVGYDQTPTSLPDRSLQIPDSNRWTASGGLRWTPQAAKNVWVDIGYAHLFVQTADIDKTKVAGTQTTIAQGKVAGGANLLGAQLTLKM